MANLKNTTINDTGAIQLPVGTTAQRPGSPVNGDTRFNSQFKVVETYDGSAWKYMPAIVENGLVLHLDAAEPASYPGTGTTWSDLSGNDYDGTLTNGVGYSSSDAGSLTFDGVDDYVAINNLGFSDHTIEGWIYSRDGSQGGTSGPDIISALGTYSEVGADKYTYIGFLGNNTLTYRLDDGTTSHRIIADTTYTANQWYHVALTYNSNGTSIAYLNGSQLEIRSYTANVVFDNTPLNIAKAENNQYFDGLISMFRIYDRALSAAEIQQNFNALRGRYGL